MIDGKNFTLNIDDALASGCLKLIPVMRPVKITDIPNGAIFRWRTEDDEVMYVMLDNSIMKRGQCLGISSETNPYKTWISLEPSLDLSYWDVDNDRWISEVLA